LQPQTEVKEKQTEKTPIKIPSKAIKQTLFPDRYAYISSLQPTPGELRQPIAEEVRNSKIAKS